MDSSTPKSNFPLQQALIAFAILASLVILVAILVDFSSTDIVALLLIVSLLCCVLVAKNVYDMAMATVIEQRIEKRLAESMLVNANEMYTELYKNSPVPYLLIDTAGHIRSANLAARRLLGRAEGKVEGLNIFTYIITNEAQHLDLLIEKYRNGVAISDETVRVKRSNDSEAWALLSLFRFDNGTEKIGLLTLVDITRQKQVENAKSEFVSLASHQLRTPIAGIKWSAELLQMDNADNLTDRQRKYIERLLSSTNRMALLIDDFLRVSRFELGTFQREYDVVNLPNFINDIVQEQTPKIEQKQIVIKTFFDPKLETLVSDQNLLRMIIGNLLSNAIKYSRESGTIHIGYGIKNDSIVISVADNGMGIPAADQDRVFSKLFRASNAVRSVPDGTGLGLYIVKEAVNVLKGNITFNSVENMSTTFEVVLPLDRPA
ncbi:MAG TPA: ATP-binding protein [Candidatus Paceibacterota bacterium]